MESPTENSEPAEWPPWQGKRLTEAKPDEPRSEPKRSTVEEEPEEEQRRDRSISTLSLSLSLSQRGDQWQPTEGRAEGAGEQ